MNTPTKPASSRRFYADSALLAFSRVAALGSGFVLIVYLARRLGPVDFGCFTAVLAYSGWLQLAATTPVHAPLVTALARHRPGEPDPLPIGLLLAAGFGLLLGAGLAVAAGPIAASLGHPQAALAAHLAGIDVVAGSLASVATAALNGRGRHRAATAVFFLHPSTRLLACIALVETGYGPVGAVVGSALASCVQAIAALAVLWPSLHFAWPKGFRQTLRESAPVSALSASLRTMQSIDLLGVVLARSPADIGIYGSAHRLAGAVAFVNNSSTLVALQELSAAHASGDLLRARAVANRQVELGLLTAGALLALAPAAPALAAVALGAKYAGHGTLFIWFTAATAARLFLANSLVLVRIARETARTTWTVLIGLAAIALFLSLAHDLRLAYIAASTAVVAGLVGLITVRRALRLWDTPWPSRVSIGVFTGLLAAGLFGLVSTGMIVWLRAIICEGLFAALALGIGRWPMVSTWLRRRAGPT